MKKIPKGYVQVKMGRVQKGDLLKFLDGEILKAQHPNVVGSMICNEVNSVKVYHRRLSHEKT